MSPNRFALAGALAMALIAAACNSPAADDPSAAVPQQQVSDLPAPFNTGDVAAGAELFSNKCSSCHSVILSEGNKQGPNLHGVFFRKPGTKAKFTYSGAMKKMRDANTHEKWTPQEVDNWLSSPKAYLPGTSMFFNGLDDANDRKNVIAYVAVEGTKP
jgi:cytochrome c